MKRNLTGLLSFTFPFTCIRFYTISSYRTRTRNDIYDRNLSMVHLKNIKMDEEAINQIPPKRIKRVINTNIQNQIIGNEISTTCVKSKPENADDTSPTEETIQQFNDAPPNLFEVNESDLEITKTSDTQMKSISSCSPLNQCIRLNDGHLLPLHGFGTYKMQHDLVEPMLKHALEVGYRYVFLFFFYFV